MLKHTIRFPFLALLVALVMVLATVLPAAALEEGYSGIRSNVVGQDVDPTEDPVGDPVDDPVDDPIDDDPDGNDPSTGFYCTQSDVQHPFGARLAARYEADYADLQDYFCQGFGWGQIMLALHTIQITGVPTDTPDTEVPTDTVVTEVPTDTVVIDVPMVFADLLEMRAGGLGWGQIWKELGFSGKPKLADAPNDEDEDGLPDDTDPSGDEDDGLLTDDENVTVSGNGNGNGKPDTTGQIKTNNGKGNGKPAVNGSGKDKSSKGKP